MRYNIYILIKSSHLRNHKIQKRLRFRRRLKNKNDDTLYSIKKTNHFTQEVLFSSPLLIKKHIFLNHR